jgi:hypothetical protein
MSASKFQFFSLLLWSLALQGIEAFVPVQSLRSRAVVLAASDNDDEPSQSPEKGGFFQGWNNFVAELDAFVDDATARRLGNGAAFYGKRKSNFHGENDKNKKEDRDSFDLTEDYAGPSNAGYFKWMQDEDGRYSYSQQLGLM